MSDAGFLEVDGGRLYYELDGQGPPLLLVHAGVANLRMWDAQLPAFAEQYRVIRYDTRGFGRTETEDVAFSNRADIAALLDHLGVGATRVLGASRGGMIALDFALERPERVTVLIVAAGGVGGYQADSSPEIDAIFEAMERLWEAREWEALAEQETRIWVDGPGQSADRVDRQIRAAVHDWILTTYQAEKAEGRPIPLDPPAAERLDQLSVPMLVMVGDLDTPGTQAGCRYLADNVPGASFELFEGAAHMLNLEQPDRFNRLVLDFLATSGRGSRVPGG